MAALFVLKSPGDRVGRFEPGTFTSTAPQIEPGLFAQAKFL
jgi:hypothetical protein